MLSVSKQAMFETIFKKTKTKKMSNYEFTADEIKIQIYSKNENPYAMECPNRHLWSEGYYSGYKDCIKRNKDEIKLFWDEKEAECESLRKQIREMYNTPDIDFIQWYSGMTKEKILSAFERYKNEMLKS